MPKGRSETFTINALGGQFVNESWFSHHNVEFFSKICTWTTSYQSSKILRSFFLYRISNFRYFQHHPYLWDHWHSLLSLEEEFSKIGSFSEGSNLHIPYSCRKYSPQNWKLHTFGANLWSFIWGILEKISCLAQCFYRIINFCQKLIYLVKLAKLPFAKTESWNLKLSSSVMSDGSDITKLLHSFCSTFFKNVIRHGPCRIMWSSILWLVISLLNFELLIFRRHRLSSQCWTSNINCWLACFNDMENHVPSVFVTYNIRSHLTWSTTLQLTQTFLERNLSCSTRAA